MAGVRQEAKKREEFPQHDYLIYFVDKDELSWWDYVFRTREGFRHCFVTQWCEWSKRWIMLDWRLSSTELIVFYDFEIELLVRGTSAMKGTVVRFSPTKPPDTERQIITYCSNIISRFLGLGSELVLTPYGLYRRLLKSGGEVVFSWRDHHGR